MGIILIFTVETGREGEKDSDQLMSFESSRLQNQHVSYEVSLMQVHTELYLRICSSNWTVLCVSFNRGTVKRSPAHSCKEIKDPTY